MEKPSVSDVKLIALAFGGVSALARALGISISTVHSWVRSGRIPPWRLTAVLAAAPSHELPDTVGGLIEAGRVVQQKQADVA